MFNNLFPQCLPICSNITSICSQYPPKGNYVQCPVPPLLPSNCGTCEYTCCTKPGIILSNDCGRYNQNKYYFSNKPRKVDEPSQAGQFTSSTLLPHPKRTIKPAALLYKPQVKASRNRPSKRYTSVESEDIENILTVSEVRSEEKSTEKIEFEKIVETKQKTFIPEKVVEVHKTEEIDIPFISDGDKPKSKVKEKLPSYKVFPKLSYSKMPQFKSKESFTKTSCTGFNKRLLNFERFNLKTGSCLKQCLPICNMLPMGLQKCEIVNVKRNVQNLNSGMCGCKNINQTVLRECNYQSTFSPPINSNKVHYHSPLFQPFSPRFNPSKACYL